MSWPKKAPWAAFGIFALWTGALSLLRFATWHSRSLDMAYYVRIVWGLAHGRLDVPVVGAENLLGLHLEPVLLPLAALARLGLPIAPTLLVVQALGTAAAIFPAARLARRRLAPVAGEGWAFAAALSILLLPTVSRCVDYDFHPSTIAIWPLLALVDALDAGEHRRAAAWFAFALLFREDVGLVGACLGLSLVRTRPRLAAAYALVGLSWFFGYTLLVQPLWLPGHGSFDAHFAPFLAGGSGVGHILGAAVRHPVDLARYLVSGDRLIYAPLLLLQVALLPLFAPRWLLGALPLFAINLLSDFPRVRTLQAHYATDLAPFLCAAGICGAAWLCARLRSKLPAAALLLAAASACCLRGASPGSPEWSAQNYRDDDYARAARALAAGVPAAARVIAPHRILAHLAERPIPAMPAWPPPDPDVVIADDPRSGLPVLH